MPARSDAAVDAIGVVLSGMFMGWPMFGAGKEQIAGMTVRYLGAVAELPVWAVQEAVNRWRDGKWELQFGESFDKIPSSATLKRIAEHVLNIAESELHCLERIDAATARVPVPEQTPEQRARMAAKLEALSEEIGIRLIDDTRRQPNAAVAEIAAAARARQAEPELGGGADVQG